MFGEWRPNILRSLMYKFLTIGRLNIINPSTRSVIFRTQHCQTYATMATDPQKYLLNHTMLRVKDPRRSIKFYELLGMKQINKIEMPDAKFDLYFLAYDSPKSLYQGKPWTSRQGILEVNLTLKIDSFSNMKTWDTGPLPQTCGSERFIVQTLDARALLTISSPLANTQLWKRERQRFPDRKRQRGSSQRIRSCL